MNVDNLLQEGGRATSCWGYLSSYWWFMCIEFTHDKSIIKKRSYLKASQSKFTNVGFFLNEQQATNRPFS